MNFLSYVHATATVMAKKFPKKPLKSATAALEPMCSISAGP